MAAGLCRGSRRPEEEGERAPSGHAWLEGYAPHAPGASQAKVRGDPVSCLVVTAEVTHRMTRVTVHRR